MSQYISPIDVTLDKNSHCIGTASIQCKYLVFVEVSDDNFERVKNSHHSVVWKKNDF